MCELRIEILRSKAAFEATMSKVFETQPQEELNCVWERTNTEDLYAVLWYVEALLLAMSPERSQPLVSWDESPSTSTVYNTRVQSCHENFGRTRVRNVHVGCTH